MKKTSPFMKRFKLIQQITKSSQILFFVAIISSMLNNVFNALVPQIIRITVDSIVGEQPFNVSGFFQNYITNLGGQDFFRKNLYLIAVAVMVVALLAGIFNFISRTSIAKGSERFIENLRNKLFSHIQKLPYQWHIQHQTGDIIQRCTSDTDVVRNFVAVQMIEVFKTTFLIVFSVSIMWTMNHTLTMVSVAFIPLVITYSATFFKKIAVRFKDADEKEGELSSLIQENLTGVRVVRAFGRESHELEKFDEKNISFANAWIDMGKINGFFWGIGDFITTLQVLVIIVLGTIMTVNKVITVGDFIAFVSYNSSLVWPIRVLGRILVDMSKALVSVDRINEILDAEVEQDNPNSTSPSLNKDISFKNVSYSFNKEHMVLKNITFDIPAGTTFGILGGTGSGKSTLMHLLNRLYTLPAEQGSITIGDTNVNQIKLNWLRSNIGMVLQEPFLFSRTIKENISITDLNAPIEDIKQVAKTACIDESIENFTNGYETIVGERGVTLSGGQRQRVSIARMLMQHAPIMVFDDSLSAVDNQTDIKIRTALKENLSNSTVILISHRITTLMDADMIMVMDKGEISQIGTHQQLIDQDGIYKDIYTIQSSMKEEVE